MLRSWPPTDSRTGGWQGRWTGELELRARLDEGRATMAVVRTGGVIADIPLLLNAPMPFDAIASRDTELITLSRQRWTELLTSSPDLALRWMTSIARRLDDDRRRLVVVTSKPLVGQVAYLLLDLAEGGAAGERVVRLSHTTIAHLLGARRLDQNAAANDELLPGGASTTRGGADMSTPRVVVFDVNETLSDMAPLAARFRDVGAPDLTDRVWFASLLRDAFALTAAGASAPFATLASAGLRGILTGLPLTRDLDAAVEHVMGGFSALQVHPDVPDGVRALRESGLRLVTLSNGSAAVAERLLTGAGLREEFEQLLSVEDAGVWKPAAGSYAYAARTCGVETAEMLLVAVHPWDIDGAARAGMATAWINRDGRPYPDYFTAPTHSITALTELPGRLAV